MKKFPRCSLLDLPVLPYHRDSAGQTQVVQRAYLLERQALKAASELRPFIQRWRSVWLLRPGRAVFNTKPGSLLESAGMPLLASERALLEGHFDAKKVIAYLLQQPNEEPLHANPDARDWLVCGHLCIPGPLLRAFQVAKIFGVSHDLGLIRLYLDSYPEFIERLRDGRELASRTVDYDDEVEGSIARAV